MRILTRLGSITFEDCVRKSRDLSLLKEELVSNKNFEHRFDGTI